MSLSPKHIGILSILIYMSLSVTPGYAQTTWNYSRAFERSLAISTLSDDTSILRFVSSDTPLSDTRYAPRDLVSISGSTLSEAGRRSELRLVARDALWDLGGAFQKEFKTPLTVISGYRSAVYQQRLWDLGKCRASLCAPPGRSEHQLGLAVDLFDATNESDFMTNAIYRKYVKWLQDHAHLYGWTQSYQKGLQTDGYDVEPWHWRYVGRELASELHRLGWTYTEYVKFHRGIWRY